MSVFKYTPALIEPKVLKKTLTGRKEAIKRINHILQNAASANSLSHTIIAGPWGIGKTHFLRTIYHAVNGDIKIKGFTVDKDLFIPLIFSGEKYIGSMEKFIFVLLEYIAGSKMKEIPPIPGNIMDLTAWGDREKEIAVSYIRRFRENSGKVLVLIVDNINEIIGGFALEEQALLRDILMTGESILLIGSAPALFDSIREHNKPFYNFFEIVWFNDLTFEESKKLIKTYAEIENRTEFREGLLVWEEKLRVIYALIGGNPRIILNYYQIAALDITAPIETIFIRILDELAPYFKGWLESISKQQLEIIDAMATSPHLLTPTEIASECRLPVGIVVTQIKRLEKAGHIARAQQKRSKRVLYEINERLLEMWWQMRMPQGRRKVELLVKFYDAWYPEKKLTNDMIKQFSDLLEMSSRKLVSYLFESGNTFESAVLAIRYLIKRRDSDRIKAILQEFEKAGINELGEFLSPVSTFIKYLENNKDNEIIERLRKEERVLVEDILNFMNGKTG